jgi:hypothetical protein
MELSASGSPGARIVGACDRRPLHDDVLGLLQMPHDAVGGYLRHERIGIVDTLSAAELERERYGVSQVTWIGGREIVIVGHRWTIAER